MADGLKRARAAARATQHVPWPVHEKPRRHAAEVTSDRLLDAVDRWRDKFDADERDMIGMIRHALQQIADGER